MFLTVKTLDNGLRGIKKVPEEQMFNKSFSQNVQIYKIKNLVFNDGFIKVAGRKMERLTSRKVNLFSGLESNIEVISRGRTGHFNNRSLRISIDVMKKYYDRFINMGAVERHQDNADYYEFNFGILFFDPNPTGGYRKLCFGGNIDYQGELYDLS